MTGLIPYLDLTPDEKQELHTWLLDHQVDYHRVPAYVEFDFDSATREWRIPMYVVDTDGRMRLDKVTGEVPKVVVRRRELRPLPWPRDEPGWWQPDPHDDACWPGCPCDDPCEYCESHDCLGGCWGEEDDTPAWPIETIQVGGGVL